MHELYNVAKILKTHGLKGELKAFPLTDDYKRLIHLDHLKLIGKNIDITVEVTSARSFKNIIIIKLLGYDSIESVEPLVGSFLAVDKEHRAPLLENEYYIYDLIGMTVIDDDNDHSVGEITDIISTGANDVYEINYTADEKGSRKVYVPAIKDCVKDVDVDEGYIRIHFMDGLLDL